MNQYGDFGKETEELMTICERNDRIPPELFKEFGVKRGLRLSLIHIWQSKKERLFY